MNDSSLVQQGAVRASVDAKSFCAALKKVSAAAARKSIIPVLSEVCVRFSNGRCILTGTDLTTWMVTEIPADGDDFSFVLSRSRDVERACRYFDGRIVLERPEAHDPKCRISPIILSCGARSGEFEAYPIEDYPDMPELTGELLFSADAPALLARINRVAYATRKPSQEHRQMTSCVAFAGNQIFALDGARAAWDTDDMMTFPQPLLVPAEQLRLLKLFGRAQVDFRLSHLHLCVTDGSTTAIFRTVDDSPYRLGSAIPAKYVDEFSVSPKKLMEELRYLSDASPKTRKPYVYLQGNGLYMTVDGRRYSTSIDINRQSNLLLSLNLHYMTDALKQFAGEPMVRIKISGPNTPVVIEAEGRGDCAMILPIRLAENAAA